MTTLITIRDPSPGARPWECAIVPHAYDEAGRVQLKAMPGVRWVPDPESPNGRGYYRAPLECVPPLQEILTRSRIAKVRDERRAAPPRPADWYIPHPREGWVGLYPYQREGASWLCGRLEETGAALLADEMGLGKSAQAIAALDAAAPPGVVVVVCPKVVVRHWQAEVLKRADLTRHWWLVLGYEEARTALAGGSRPDKKGRRRIPVMPEAVACIVDEIHYCANPKALRTKAALELRARVGMVVGLSGSPMNARVRDLWQPLDLLHPGRWGKAFDFQRRYADGHYETLDRVRGQEGPKDVWVAEGRSNTEELHTRLQAVMLRRTKDEVALQLPPRTRRVHLVELPPKARASSQRASAALALSGRGSAWKDSISSLLSDIEPYKIDAACELAEDARAAGSRVLLLTTRKATARDLAQRLGAALADGDTPATEREGILRDASIGVSTMYAVTTGIDLVGYDVMIITGLDWVPSTLLQAEARIHRIGQRRNVTIWYLIGAGTLDEVVQERVISRLDTFAECIGGDSSGLRGDLGGDGEALLAELVECCRKGDW